MTEKRILPVLPLRDVVVFPHMAVSLFVGREKSICALEQVEKHDGEVLLLAQKDASVDDPSEDDLYKTGTIASILQLLKLPDGTIKVLVEGGDRAKIEGLSIDDGFLSATLTPLEDDASCPEESKALMRTAVEQFEHYVRLSRKVPAETLNTISEIEEPGLLADSIAAQLSVDIATRQKFLETHNAGTRLEDVFKEMENQIGMRQMERKIRNRVKRQMEKTQREYYLNEQMKAIRNELGDSEEERGELSELEEKIVETPLSDEALAKAKQEIKKLRHMSPMSAESTVVRNYIDWLVSLPWSRHKNIRVGLKKAEKILDTDHYGLEKVKERILEYLTVQSRTKKIKGSILCLVGPPGVGKTSLGRSIANATGRDFVRISLGGVRDEAEIRGHRRTYIGSMPGRIIQSMKKAKSANPLFLLDEIDKLGMDYRGDPASALLEVLDPEQNCNFNDHYLEVDYDLSDVMFITTANSLNIPEALRDRMEIIHITGYTEDEKLEIAQRHLLPKITKDHGLKKGEWQVSKPAIQDLIRYYTRESGVRGLEREMAKLARKSVRKIETGALKLAQITPDNLEEYSGVRKHRFGETDRQDQIGFVTGLAWTETGGDLLAIEAVRMNGRGRMTVTGNLRDVMKESISAANSLVRARAVFFGIRPPVFDSTDIHVHVPEGATPKDGPSAGIAMTTAIVSLLTGIPVSKDVALTGEITLRGRVLPIGGLKEKLLAALRGGVRTVLIPEENRKDLAEIPDNVKKRLEIIPVSDIDEVLKRALVQPLAPIQWTDADEAEHLAYLRNQSPAHEGSQRAH